MQLYHCLIGLHNLMESARSEDKSADNEYYVYSAKTIQDLLTTKHSRNEEKVKHLKMVKPGVNFELIEVPSEKWFVHKHKSPEYKSGKVVKPYKSPLSIVSLCRRVTLTGSDQHKCLIFLRRDEHHFVQALK